METLPPFVCPRCRGALDSAPDEHRCRACDVRYPVLFGIPDFRLRADPYLTLEQERDKARRLHDFAQGASFERLLQHYYEITDDVPPSLAVRYQAYVRNGPRQGAATLEALAPDPAADTLLDLGCGAGGLLLAAQGRYRQVFGVDIALRWLVICRQRLTEQNARATLVCADAEALPFADGAFTQATAGDLLEHVRDVDATLAEARRQLAPGGRLWLSATNRFCIGPHPSTRVIGIGYLPRPLRSALLRRLRGHDSLRFTQLVSPLGLRRRARAAGFQPESLRPRQLALAPDAAYPSTDQALLTSYRFLLGLRIMRAPLVLCGPAFEMVLRRP